MSEKRVRKARAGTFVLAGLAVAATGGGGGCTSGGGIQGRFVAVHNTLETLGLSQVGHISEGSLGENGTVRFPMALEGQCYTFVAFGGDGVRDIDVTLLDGSNTRVAADASHDAQATLHHCLPAAGRYTLAVHMARGSGGYLLTSWRGGPRGGVASSGSGDGDVGSCGNPIPLQPGQTVTGDTSRGRSHNNGSCIGGGEREEGSGGGAPEVVYALTIERRQQVTVAVEQEADYDGAVYIRRANCDDQGAEVPGACNDDDPDTSHSRVSVALDPGQYFVFVDGFGSSHGRYTMAVTAADVPSPAEVCQNAAPLAPNTPVSGQLTPQDMNTFQARCANGARGADKVYRLEVPQESRLQLHQESDYDGVLYMRRACADAASEFECNDDAEDVQHSRINTIVPAGTYYVYTDAYQPNGAGNYTLEADLAPVAGGNTPGDTCADAQPLSPGQPVEGNTFQAHDDVPTPCAAAADGYDVVYRLDVPARARVRLWFDQADLAEQIVLAVTRNCAQIAQNNIACRPGAVTEARGIDQVLDAGQYFVVVDSAAPRRFGRFRLNARIEDTAALDRACRGAPLLTPGHTVTGTTGGPGGQDRFQATCAAGARSPENLYRLVLRQRSSVRLSLTSTTPNYDAALYIRGTCADPATQRPEWCNDDAGDAQHSLLETTLDAGTYTVFVDGYGNSNSGSYSLEVQAHPEAGGGAGRPQGAAIPGHGPGRPPGQPPGQPPGRPQTPPPGGGGGGAHPH